MTVEESAGKAVDVVAGSAVVVTWVDLLPFFLEVIVLVLTGIWFGLRIWESETVRGWTDRKKSD